jgi:hypothetical protein
MKQLHSQCLAAAISRCMGVAKMTYVLSAGGKMMTQRRNTANLLQSVLKDQTMYIYGKRANFVAFGASEERRSSRARPPRADEMLGVLDAELASLLQQGWTVAGLASDDDYVYIALKRRKP